MRRVASRARPGAEEGGAEIMWCLLRVVHGHVYDWKPEGNHWNHPGSRLKWTNKNRRIESGIHLRITDRFFEKNQAQKWKWQSSIVFFGIRMTWFPTKGLSPMAKTWCAESRIPSLWLQETFISTVAISFGKKKVKLLLPKKNGCKNESQWSQAAPKSDFQCFPSWTSHPDTSKFLKSVPYLAKMATYLAKVGSHRISWPPFAQQPFYIRVSAWGSVDGSHPT